MLYKRAPAGVIVGFCKNVIKLKNDMKTTIKIIFAIIILSLVMLNSCRYKEGPGISFRTVKERIRGNWHVDKCLINGQDATEKYFEEFNCDFAIANYTGAVTGPCRYGYSFQFNYKLEKGESIFVIIMGDPGYLIPFGPFCKNCKSNWNIRKLSQTEWIIVTDFNGINYRMELSKLSEYGKV